MLKRGEVALAALFIAAAVIAVFYSAVSGMSSFTGYAVGDAEEPSYGILAAPSMSSIVINSTYGTNYTAENLTCWANAADSDGDNLTFMAAWRMNSANWPPVSEAWNVTFDGGSTDYGRGVAVDSNDNIAVIASMLNGAISYEYFTIKYDSSGAQLWNRTYDGGGNDHPYSVVFDSQGSVIVTGTSRNGTNDNYFTIKYDSNGNEVWNSTYDGGNADKAYAVAADSQDNIIITGPSRIGANDDYFTIKYNSSGAQLWNRTYDGGNADTAYSAAVDSNDNIIITGVSNNGIDQDYFTIKYDSSGNHIWNRTYNNGSFETAYSAATDSNDNVIVAGYALNGTKYSFFTIKYDSSGNHIWNRTYDSGNIDYGRSVQVDSHDNVIVSGEIGNGANNDYFTIKYDSSGNHIWNRTYDSLGADNVDDSAVDSMDNVIITGTVNNNAYTIKYDEGYFAAYNTTQGITAGIGILDSGFTSIGDVWSCEARAYDGSNYTGWMASSNLTVQNAIPTQGIPVLNATTAYNTTNDNLTVYNVSTYDSDSDAVTNVIDWRLNGTSIALLNMPFDTNITENTADAIRDYSQFGSNATLGGGVTSKSPKWVQGKVGGAYLFDGSNDYINRSEIPGTDAAAAISISYWVKYNNVSGYQYDIYEMDKYQLGLYNNMRPTFYINKVGTGWTSVNTTEEIAAGEWYHIAVTYDGSSLRIYLNGVLNATSGATSGVLSTQNRPFCIGADCYNNQYSTNGTIDEVMIFSRALSAKQIWQMFADGSTGIHISTIASNETLVNNAWSACVTPNDAKNDGATNCSNSITVLAESDSILPSVAFKNQTPADIDSSNLFGVGVNITYNISDETALNISTVKLYHKVNATEGGECLFFANGSYRNCGYEERDPVSNTSSLWQWRLFDNQVYPAIYNWPDERQMELEPHSKQTLNTLDSYLKVKLFNVSNSRVYSVFEVMANQTNAASLLSLRIYYCNSSYTSGSVIASANCVSFYTVAAGTPYNHSHSAYSSHLTIPFAINLATGKIGTVYVTPTSYFIIRGRSGSASWDVWYIPNITREDTIQYTTNIGVTWTNFSGTVDAHLHQYDSTDSLWYYACANDTSGNQNCSAPRKDLLNLTGVPPTSPSVYSPAAGDYIINITINYTESESPNAYPITFYNISLVYANETFVKTINSNNSVNLSYVWDSSNTTPGSYLIKVVACDSVSQCSAGYSEQFTILEPDTASPTFSSASTTTTSERYSNFTARITINDNRNLSSYIFSTNASGTWINDSAVPITGVQYNASTSKNLTAVAGSTVCWRYWANDTSRNNATSATYCSISITNHAPAVSAISIAPSLPNENSNLTCNYTIYDVDENQTFTFIFNWYRNNIAQNINSQVLDAGNTTGLEKWNCSVNVSDGYATALRISSSVTIADTTKPQFANALVTSDDQINTNFTANITVSDNVNLSRFWFSHNMTGSWQNSTPSSISGMQYNASATILITLPGGSMYCWRYYANDTSGNMNSSNMYCQMVQNTAPIISSVSISPSLPTELNNLTCTYNAADADNQSLTAEFNWYRNGAVQAINSQVLDAGNITAGETWNCSVNVTDGSASDYEMSADATIADASAPIVLLISPADSASTTETNITFVYNASDISGIANCSLIINDSVNQTDATVTSGEESSFSAVLAIGAYGWRINCTDNLSNSGAPSEYLLTITAQQTQTGGGGSLEQTCFDECEDGNKVCRDGSMYVCGDFDLDTCTEWGIEQCDRGYTCEEGKCIKEACVEDWVCSGWSSCADGKQERMCDDWNKCGTMQQKPEEVKECTLPEKQAEQAGKIVYMLPFDETPTQVIHLRDYSGVSILADLYKFILLVAGLVLFFMFSSLKHK